jgi:hypothetical protein
MFFIAFRSFLSSLNERDAAYFEITHCARRLMQINW